MEESGGDGREGREEISLLAEELVMLSVNGSKKTRKKFEIQMVGQNLFSIIFELADDLELILEAMDRDQIRLTLSSYWMKIDSNFLEFDKKDLLHAIGATFGGRPLQRGIFVSTDAVSKVLVPFKYENLPMFCFGCGRMSHGLSNCAQLTSERKSKISENPPYSLALKAELKLFGKESIKFNILTKKVGANVRTLE
ncbi:hypothetical protein Golob_024952, partial [Gossypium lobatum]|nr:hypothetical protein [Gossypium lobatum]